MEKGDLHFDSENLFQHLCFSAERAGEKETLYVCFFFLDSDYINNVIANNLHLLGSRKQSRQTGGMGVSCVSGILLSLETEGGSSVETGSVDS